MAKSIKTQISEKVATREALRAQRDDLANEIQAKREALREMDKQLAVNERALMDLDRRQLDSIAQE